MDNDQLNIHDPHDEYTWVDTTPTWVTVLKWVGLTTAFISGAIGTAIGCYLFTVIMFQL